MADSTGLGPYRPGQGVYARGAAGVAMLLLAVFACLRLYVMWHTETEGTLKLVGLTVPYSGIWAAGLFVVLASIVFLFTFGLGTGLGFLDRKTRATVDLLVDTEGELAKVSWPKRDELLRSTSAVLVLIIVLGILLFGVDKLVAFVLGMLDVLPT